MANPPSNSLAINGAHELDVVQTLGSTARLDCDASHLDGRLPMTGQQQRGYYDRGGQSHLDRDETGAANTANQMDGHVSAPGGAAPVETCLQQSLHDRRKAGEGADEEAGADDELLGEQIADDGDGHDDKGEDAEQRDEDVDENVDEDEEDEIDPVVAQDMKKLEENFTGISRRFQLVNRIGEGTFSTVYKARDLLGEGYDGGYNGEGSKRRRIGRNGASRITADENTHPTRLGRKNPPRYVALKKIYVTSSPIRIRNELELLASLRGHDTICPLLTAFRHQDQVVAVLPFFPHTDFRLMYRTFLVDDMRYYFRSLFEGLRAVHKAGIIHRDIKPTNFLYNPELKKGVLVDFGLAERYIPRSSDSCPCIRRNDERIQARLVAARRRPPPIGYPKTDSRPTRRANRAGTRGFRAPEVLFKCTAQSPKIDIWSVGVILLTFLGRRFPFFNSMDDVEALIEIATIFGLKRMRAAALLHGQVFDTDIPSIGEFGYSLHKIVQWAYCSESELTPAEQQACNFLLRLLELDPVRRYSARQALRHEFFTAPVMEDAHPWERARLLEKDDDRARKALYTVNDEEMTTDQEAHGVEQKGQQQALEQEEQGGGHEEEQAQAEGVRETEDDAETEEVLETEEEEEE
ncbi:hypothetical protein KEM52_005342, partial [Ascosphaera acerosa]